MILEFDMSVYTLRVSLSPITPTNNMNFCLSLDQTPPLILLNKGLMGAMLWRIWFQTYYSLLSFTAYSLLISERILLKPLNKSKIY